MTRQQKKTGQVASSQTTVKSTDPAEKVNIGDKLWNWFLFNIIIASLPILFHIVILVGDGHAINFFDLFSHGELLLISVAIIADAIGELIFKGKTKGKNSRSIGFCIIIGFLSVGEFASLGINGTASNTAYFALVSIFLFIASIASGANCKISAES